MQPRAQGPGGWSPSDMAITPPAPTFMQSPPRWRPRCSLTTYSPQGAWQGKVNGPGSKGCPPVSLQGQEVSRPVGCALGCDGPCVGQPTYLAKCAPGHVCGVFPDETGIGLVDSGTQPLSHMDIAPFQCAEGLNRTKGGGRENSLSFCVTPRLGHWCRLPSRSGWGCPHPAPQVCSPPVADRGTCVIVSQCVTINGKTRICASRSLACVHYVLI